MREKTGEYKTRNKNYLSGKDVVHGTRGEGKARRDSGRRQEEERKERLEETRRMSEERKREGGTGDGRGREEKETEKKKENRFHSFLTSLSTTSGGLVLLSKRKGAAMHQ